MSTEVGSNRLLLVTLIVSLVLFWWFTYCFRHLPFKQYFDANFSSRNSFSSQCKISSRPVLLEKLVLFSNSQMSFWLFSRKLLRVLLANMIKHKTRLKSWVIFKSKLGRLFSYLLAFKNTQKIWKKRFLTTIL